MSDVIVNQIINATAIRFDALRGAFLKDDAACYLIKRDGQTSNFELVLEVPSAWFVTFERYRFSTRTIFDLFEFARTDDEFKDAIGEASHIALRSKVYAIDPNQRSTDVLEGEGFDPWWFVYANLDKDLTFTPESWLLDRTFTGNMTTVEGSGEVVIAAGDFIGKDVGDRLVVTSLDGSVKVLDAIITSLVDATTVITDGEASASIYAGHAELFEIQ